MVGSMTDQYDDIFVDENKNDYLLQLCSFISWCCKFYTLP